MIAAAVVGVAGLSGCVPGSEAKSESPEVRLYTGEIPPPASAPSPVAMPEPPVPPTDVGDAAAWAEYEAAAQEYIEQMQNLDSGGFEAFHERVAELAAATARSDAESIAAWQTLLIAAGIAIDLDGRPVEVNGDIGAGIPMVDGELRLHALLGALPGRILLTELAAMLEGGGFLESDDIAGELYDALREGSATPFGTVFVALEPSVFGEFGDGPYEPKALEDVTLTGAQAALVLRRLSVELLAAADADTPAASGLPAGPAVAPALAVTSADAAPASGPVAAADPTCLPGEKPWDAEARRTGSKVSGNIFTTWLGKATGAGPQIAGATAVLAIGTMLAKLMLLTSDFQMPDSPLVRTKNRQPGEERTITVTMSYPSGPLADVNRCLSILLGPYGVELPDFFGGAGGIGVDFVLTGDRLQYGSGSGTDVYSKVTDDDGRALFEVAGKAQPERLPEGAEPEEVTSGVRLDANVQASDLVKDLISLAFEMPSSWGAMLMSMLQRMKLLSYTWDIPVRDWTLSAEFDVTLAGSLSGHQASNQAGSGECGAWSFSSSTSAEGTVASVDPIRVRADYLTGGRLDGIIFRTLGVELHEIVIDADGAELVHLGSQYSASKRTQQPGAEPLPPLYTDPHYGGCGDGDGSGAPASDCGPRDYLGVVTVNALDGQVHLTENGAIGRVWSNCGAALRPNEPLAAPSTLGACSNPARTGGEVPSPDVVFSERGSFEISGALTCDFLGNGVLEQYEFDWTLEFCRVVDGEAAC